MHARVVHVDRSSGQGLGSIAKLLVRPFVFFFLEMRCSRPLHQLMHTAVILKSEKMIQVYK
jgi:hypothetical protein